jgi:internalin A
MIEEKIIEIIEQEEIERSGKLNLSDMGLETVPEKILQLTHLTSIDLSRNRIEDISLLKELTDLEAIDLSYNKIVDIDSIQYLRKLEFLNLSNNRIPFLSPLKELKELKILNVSKNRILSIVALSDLNDLQVLNLSWNNIQDIHPFSNHKNLIHLGLHKTKIKNINNVSTINNLNSLDIGGNFISNYKSLSKLEKLVSLNVSHSKIKNYDFLYSIKELISLNLCNNNLIEIGFLKNLSQLENLSLSSNKIEDISTLARLVKLNTLNLDKNLINDITPIAPLLKKGLTISIDFKDGNIRLEENPITTPPFEIVQQGRQSVLNWFSAIKKELKEIKIILIGEPKAGKTSLLRRLNEDRFEENETQTDGINIERIEFGNCQTFEKQKSLHKLTGYFWDFGGQEIMHATHQFFLTKRSVYLLVLDARKDNEIANQIRQWVKRIKSTGGNSDIVIIANQCDLNSGFGFENEYELQKEFPQIKLFIKISCKTGENLSLVKEKLEALIPKAELFNSEIDERWINIKELLQVGTNVDYYLGEDRFREICLASSLDERDAQKNAISFLHDLGLVLHFNEVVDHEYFVLDPYWITYGVYQILTSNLAGNKKGIVNISDLEFIINEEEDKREIYQVSNFKKISYNNHQRRFLLDMLCQFRLCFYLPDRRQFIIPDLLETAEPHEFTEPIRNSANSINLVYDYEYLPKSVMPQILVETHFLHFKIWRTGCILKYRDCIALIISYGNQIRIKVSDGHRSKKDLLAIIRNTIDQINERLTNNTKILIPLPGTNEFVGYEELLERDKDGETVYKIYKPEKREFEISQLLEGISTKDEVKQLLYEIKQNQVKQSQEHSTLITNIAEVKNKLDQHYQYLIDQPQNNQLKELILEGMTTCTDQQTKEITDEIIRTISNAFEIHQGDLNEKFKEIFTDFKKTTDLQIKLKLGIPLINLLGIDLAAEFNIKSWASKMYQKYELKIFQIMGLV